MEKLELKHLAPYLPYNLKLANGLIIKPECFGVENLISVQLVINRNHLKEYKPILRPLSDLAKEIEVNGEKFVPILELSRDYLPPNYRDWIEIKSTDKCNYYEVGCVNDKIKSFYRFNKNPKDLPYRIVRKLFKWHFDIFGLIEKGLAISIHDVKI